MCDYRQNKRTDTSLKSTLQTTTTVDVLLVNIEINASEPCGFNLGLSSIAGALQQNGISSFQTYVDSFSALANLGKIATGLNAKIVGLSVVDSQVVVVSKVIQCLRASGVEFVCIGGPVATIAPTLLTDIDGVDLVYRGEGELFFVDICQLVLEYGASEGLHRIIVDNAINGQAAVTRPQALSSPFTIAEPIREKWYQNIIEKDGYASFMFSRGCHRNCNYCSNHALKKALGLKPGYRYKNPSAAIFEIKEVQTRFKFNQIHFHDDCFAISSTWRKEFLRLYKRDIGLPFSCNIDPDKANKTYLTELKDSGCISVAMGVECGDEQFRFHILGRRISNSSIINAFSKAQKVGLKTVSLTMIGLPNETREQLQATVDLNSTLGANEVCVYFFFPYRGTRLYDHCLSEGLVAKHWWDQSGERSDPLPGMCQVTKQELLLIRDQLTELGKDEIHSNAYENRIHESMEKNRTK